MVPLTTALIIGVLAIASTTVFALPDFRTRAWQDIDGKFSLPEADVPELQHRPSTAISFSGGGTRAYVASLGYLAAFHELEIMNRVRYLCGVSGGSFGVIVYQFAQSNISDATLLGPIINPEDMSPTNLKHIDKDCARGSSDVDIVWETVKHIPVPDKTGEYVFDGYRRALQDAYLKPFNIPAGVPFSHDKNTVKDIKRRNPALRDVDFVLPRQARPDGPDGEIIERPLMLSLIAMLGPKDMTPILPDNRDYTVIEVTGLSAGILHTRNATYQHKSKPYKAVVGGLVEPFAFGASSKASNPTHGLPAGQGSGELAIKYNDAMVKSPILDVAYLAAAGGWAAGSLMASFGGSLPHLVGETINYWSPAVANPAATAQDMIISDGGHLETDNLVSFIQRGVKSILMFCIGSRTPKLPPQWDPRKGLRADDIDYDIPSFFGVYPVREGNNLKEYQINQSHVFPTEDWVPLALKIQASLQAGNGIVVTSEHTTIRNDYFGIPAGQKVKVTWVYLSRVKKWEDQLSDEMKSLLLPETNPEDMSSIRETGPYKGYPYFKSGVIASSGGFNAEQANILGSLAGWTIKHNADIFRKALA